MFHVFTDALLGQAFVDSVVDKDVASHSSSYLVVNVAMDTELALCPGNVNLESCQQFGIDCV